MIWLGWRCRKCKRRKCVKIRQNFSLFSPMSSTPTRDRGPWGNKLQPTQHRWHGDSSTHIYRRLLLLVAVVKRLSWCLKVKAGTTIEGNSGKNHQDAFENTKSPNERQGATTAASQSYQITTLSTSGHGESSRDVFRIGGGSNSGKSVQKTCHFYGFPRPSTPNISWTS